MRIRSIHARLKKLEARVPPPPPTKEQKLSVFYLYLRLLAVGYYLGNPQPDDMPYAACARAFGVEGVDNLFSLFKASPKTMIQHEAFDRLLAKFGVSWSDGSDTLSDTLIDAHKRMADGFSERYKKYLRWYAQELGIEWPFA